MPSQALSYTSERAFLDHSVRIAAMMPNMKLATLRKILAGADNFKNVENYRKALRNQTASPQDSTGLFNKDNDIHEDDVAGQIDRIAIDGNMLRFTMEAFLPYGLDDCHSDSDIDHINDTVEKILTGNNGLIQDIDTTLIRKGDVRGQSGRYIISGAIDLDDAPDAADLVNAVRYFMYSAAPEAIIDGDTKPRDEQTPHRVFSLHKTLLIAFIDQNPMILVTLENNDDPESHWCNESVIDLLHDAGISPHDGFTPSIISAATEHLNDWEQRLREE